MTRPRICTRGVGRTRVPSLYQLTAIPGRVLRSQRSFRTLPGSSRRCSVVSSVSSSRTSVKTPKPRVSVLLLFIICSFGRGGGISFTLVAVRGLFLHLPFKTKTTLQFWPSALQPYYLLLHPPQTHTKKLPWWPGGLADPTLLQTRPPPPSNPCLLPRDTEKGNQS